MSFLPLAWIGEQMLSVACGLQAGFTLSFAEDAATVRADVREIGPRVMFSPPRIWETLLSSVQVQAARLRLAQAQGLRGLPSPSGGARQTGDCAGDASASRSGSPTGSPRPLRFARCEISSASRACAGPIPAAPRSGRTVFRFFHAIGVNLKQIYGQTEICGIAVIHRDDDIRFNTVGVGIPGTDVAIAESGEILLRSPAVFKGLLPRRGGDGGCTSGWMAAHR